MNICMFARSLLCHAVGGMELHTHLISKALAELGHDVAVITTSSPEGKNCEKIDGYEIFYTDNTPPGRYSRKWWIKSIEKFNDIHRDRNFDIVHSQSAGAYGFLRKEKDAEYGLPVVVSMHGTSIDEIKTRMRLGLFNVRAKLGMVKNLYNYFLKDRYYLSRSSAVIATSDKQFRTITRNYPVKKDKVFLVYNGIDEKRFTAAPAGVELMNRLGIKKDDRVILCVARLKKEKGIQNMLKAFPELRSEWERLKLVIVGDGEYRKVLESMASDFKAVGEVIFTGKVPYEQLPDYFNLCDIFINPTVRENGYDLTILQAMACSRPVVCSDLGSIETVVKPGWNGLVFPREDSALLKEKIDELLDDTRKREVIGEHARSTVEEKFSLRAMAGGTVRVYEKILSGSKL